MILFRRLLTFLLTLACLSLGALAWRQYDALDSLRTQLMGADPSLLRQQLANSRKTIRSLEDQLAALRGRHSRRNSDADGSNDPDQAGAFQGPGNRRGRFAELSANPEFQKLMAIQAKGRVDQTYAALYKSLNLSPEQLQQFQSLLVEKQQALMDVLQSARQQGVSPQTDPAAFKQLVNQAEAQVDANIQQTLGAGAYQQYQQYQQTLPEQNTVNQLQQALSYTQTPLTPDQASQMVQLLSQYQPERAGSGTSATGGGDGGPGIGALLGNASARVTDDAVAQAPGVLSGPQVQALQQLEQQQTAQRQMQQMLRGGTQAAPAATPASP